MLSVLTTSEPMTHVWFYFKSGAFASIFPVLPDDPPGGSTYVKRSLVTRPYDCAQ